MNSLLVFHSKSSTFAEDVQSTVTHQKRGATITSHPKGINPYYECGN